MTTQGNYSKSQVIGRMMRAQGKGGVSGVSVIQAQPIQQRVLRYAASAAGTSTVKAQDLLSWFGVVTTANTTAYCPISAVRVRRIVVQGSVATNNALDPLSLTWLGGTDVGSLQRTITASASTGGNSRISSVPPAGSAVGMWHASNGTITQPLFEVSGFNTGDIVDVHLEYVLSAGGSLTGSNTNGITVGITAGSLGHAVYGNLGAASNLVPVGLNAEQFTSWAAY